MPTQPEIIGEYLSRQLVGLDLSDEEREAILDWVLLTPANQSVYNDLADEQKVRDNLITLLSIDKQEAYLQLSKTIHHRQAAPSKIVRIKLMLTIAASAMLVIAGIWFLHSPKAVIVRSIDYTKDGLHLPATARGIYVIGDLGKICNIDTLGEGAFPSTAATLKYPATIAYHGRPGPERFNRITTSPGRQCKVLLSDGSLIYLKENSSIRFPTSFTGTTVRMVEMSGVGYFNVSSSSKRPFKVLVRNTLGDSLTIEALGTRFLINTVDTIAISTTLFQGSVQIRAGSSVAPIKPGMLATINLSTSKMVERPADTSLLLKWTGEKIIFQNVPKKVFLDSLAKSYDVHFQYEGNSFSNSRVGAGIDPWEPLDQAIKKLEINNWIHAQKINDTLYLIKP